MITEQELNISNKSYTNKDFASIYQEILDLAKKLSNRFDPETSNESDPFIVLMKLLSFMGDKINYNIDKNILERFMPSATQESSMRNLCEMMGYNMHYYIAPETTITIQYVGSADLTNKSFTIPQYTYVSNSNSENENKVNFFIKNRNITIDNKNTIYGTEDEQGYYDEDHGNIVVIEGELKDLTILGDTNIHLDNLDSNNRIYFPEKMVAENGVFITNDIDKGIENEWVKIDNLNIRDNLFVYKFGYDSLKGLPYIEFPDNISALIGDGLKIKYTVTSGLSGNINSKVLNCLTISELNYDKPYQDETINVGEKEDGIYPLVITNINAAINGKNPESINEAYNGFKKTIGTFNTLVTCRDYMNYIYNLLDDDEIYSLVSNIMVSDRRTDINYSTPIVTFGAGGQTTITAIEQIEENNTEKDALTPYDLCLYPLQTYKQDNLENFVNSFKPETNQTLIKQKIEDSRCISHDYKDLVDTDIYLIKNYLTLTCRIGTTYKVNASEQAKIIENIQRALAHDYNARNVDYGYEIPYDSLVQTIENADSRIKSVTLYEPDLETKVMFKNSDEKTKATSSGTFNTIIAKNIMSGRYQLFDYNTDFNYEYGQQQINSVPMLYENIKSVDTKTTIALTTTNTTLKENQQIQIIWPNVVTEVIYPYGQRYASNFNCNAEVIHTLESDEYIAFFWTDTEKSQRYTLLGPGDIIKPSFDIKNNSGEYTSDYYISSSKISSEDLTILTSELRYDQINGMIKVYPIPSAQDQVEKLYINKEEVTTTCYCYWLLNNSNNSIFSDASETEYVLDSGEYFYKTDSSFNTLAIYGAGTKITRTSGLTGFGECDIVDISKLSEQGLLGQRDKFKIISCTDNYKLTFTENNILTLNAGDTCNFNANNITLNINNTWKPLDNYEEFKYQLKNESELKELDSIEGISNPYQIRSRLNINSGPNLGQIINSEDSFEFKDKDGEPVLSISGDDYENCYFRLNELRQLSGGVNTNLAEVNYLVDKNSPERYNLLKLYLYGLSNNVALYQPDYQGYIRTILNENTSYELDIPNLGKESLIMIWTNETGTNDSVVSITKEPAAGTLVDYFTGDPMGTNLYKGLNIISIENVNTITLENSSSSGAQVSLVISKLSVLNEEVNSAILAKIRELDKKYQFYYNYIPDNSKFIDEQDILDPHAFYDYNNLYNKWTMSEIDFKNSIIEIARGSRA